MMGDEPKRFRWLIWAAVLISALTAMYVLSYAPYLRWRYGAASGRAAPDDVLVCSLPDSDFTGNSRHTFYAPVEWLVCHTALEWPLRNWAEMWDIEDKVFFDAVMRLSEERTALAP